MLSLMVILLTPINLLGADPSDFLVLVTPIFIAQKVRKFWREILFFFVASSYVLVLVLVFKSPFLPAIQFILGILVLATLIRTSSTHRKRKAVFFTFLMSTLAMLTVSFFVAPAYLPDFFFPTWRHGRFMSFLGDPNFTAFLCAILIFISFKLAKGTSGQVRRSGVFHLLIVFLLLFIAYATKSRSGLAACILVFGIETIGIVWCSLRRRYSRTFSSVLTLVTLMLIAGTSTGVVMGMLDREDTTNLEIQLAEKERFELYYPRAGMNIAIERMFVPVGVGNLAMHMQVKNPDGVILGAHNTFVQIIAELGLPGLILLFLFFGQLAVFRFRSKNWNADSLIVALCFFSMFQDMLTHKIFFLCLGIIIVSLARKESKVS